MQASGSGITYGVAILAIIVLVIICIIAFLIIKAGGTAKIKVNDSTEMAPHSNVMDNNQTNGLSEEYRPISMWGYFGYELLFSIPCVGLIMLLVFSLGGTKNVNLRNFARSYFCFWIVKVVLIVIVFLLFGSAIAGIMYR